MVALLLLLGRALALALRGHRELVFENLALRQQLTALTRATKRPALQTSDRLFWIALTRIWRNWRTALVLVQPDTVVRWHRDWLRRRWTRCSKSQPTGRPPTEPQIRALIRETEHEELCLMNPDTVLANDSAPEWSYGPERTGPRHRSRPSTDRRRAPWW